jgi:hypothetical protein
MAKEKENVGIKRKSQPTTQPPAKKSKKEVNSLGFVVFAVY